MLQLFDNSWNFLARNLIHKAEHPCSEWLCESDGEIGGKTRENSEEVNGSRLKELPVWYKIKLSSMLIRFRLPIPHQMFSFTLVAQLSSYVVKI